MADDITSNTANRLSINVPGYDTRINMGTPDPTTPGGDGSAGYSFGYTGFGVHTLYNFFVDVGRVGLYQSNLGSCWQVGGKWLQWSNQDMYMATMGNNTVAADSKVLIAAGAGMGQITALTAAGAQFESPRLVDYNNLALHWRVDAVQVALKEFFYGKDTWKGLTTTRKDDQAHYSDSDSADSPTPTKHYPGGFLKDVDTFLSAVGAQGIKPGLLQGFEWEGDRKDMTHLFNFASYFSAFEPFDPYPPTPVAGKGFYSVLSNTYAGTVQVLNWIHRVVDTSKKFTYALTDNVYVKRVQSVIQAWQDGQDMVGSIMNGEAFFEDQNGKVDFSRQWTRPGGEGSVIESHWPWKSADGPGTAYNDATAAELDSTTGAWDIGPPPQTLVVTDDTHVLTITFTAGNIVTVGDLVSALGGASGPGWTVAWTTPSGAMGSGPGNWTVSADGSTVTITHNTPGAASHLNASGSAASVFFSTVVDDRGTDASGAVDGSLQFEAIDRERSVQISFSSLPEDCRDSMRPIYNAISDWLGVADKFASAAGDIGQAIFGQVQPPSMIGLIAKDGITLGTPRPIYGTGGGITFVATQPADDIPQPDHDKFVRGVEDLVKDALDGEGFLKERWKKAQDALSPDSDIRKGAMPGNFRVAAQNDVVVTASGRVMQVALSETVLLSKKRMIAGSNAEVSLRSVTKSVELLGAEIRVGATKDSGKQKATEKVNIAASSRIDLRTKDVRGAFDLDLIALGKNDSKKAWVVPTKPHLFIDTQDGYETVMAGYWSGTDFMGLDAQGTGEIGLTGKSVRIGVKSGPGIDIGKQSGKVVVYGNLKCGTSLNVTNSATFTPRDAFMEVVSEDFRATVDKSDLTTQYGSMKDAATSLKDQLDNPPDDDAPDAEKTAYQTKRVTMRGHYDTHNALIESAKSKEFIAEDIGWTPVNEDLFVRRAPDDPSAASGS